MMVAYALWVVALLALMVSQLSGDLHRAVVEERRALDHAALRAAAISGLEAYRFAMIEYANREYSYRQEPIRSEPALCAYRTASGVRTACFDTLPRRQTVTPQLTFGASDEESRINILRVDAETIARLPGVTESMAQDLAAYVQTSPDAVLQTPEDLRRIPGWEGIDAAELARLITFFGDGRVNLNTASTQVLDILGIPRRAIRDLQEYLSGPNGTRGDEDDLFFKGVSEIGPRLDEARMDEETVEFWSEIAEMGAMTLSSRHYRVRARAIDESSGRQHEVEAIVHLDDQATILAWWEHRPS